MAKVRFLQSALVLPLNQVYGYNDELDIEDEKLAKELKEQGIVDILVEEKVKSEAKISKKTAKKEVI